VSRLRALLDRLRPEGDIEATFISGLAMVALGFLVAQLLGSILYAPLSLIVPGSVLTVVSLRARPEPVEESE
jgi:hypothetical protein